MRTLTASAVLALSPLTTLDAAPPTPGPAGPDALPAPSRTVYHRRVELGGLELAYREAGPPDAPAILLLHGFPTSSHMFRDLMPTLADAFRLVAPDYPGFGNSSMPGVDAFEYTFDNLASVVADFTDAVGLERYTLYLMDYGAPIGFRLATARPERVDALVIQNGNAYDEGLREFWDPLRAYWAERSEEHAAALLPFLEREGTIWQYTHGVRDVAAISPDNWNVDQPLLDRPGNRAIQLQLFHDYGSNPPLYPHWQRYLREHRPRTLIVWGANDLIFPAEGARAFLRDVPDAELHLLDTGHFALEEDGAFVADRMRAFLSRDA